jgi:hypothetical protein
MLATINYAPIFLEERTRMLSDFKLAFSSSWNTSVRIVHSLLMLHCHVCLKVLRTSSLGAALKFWEARHCSISPFSSWRILCTFPTAPYSLLRGIY